MKTIGYRIASRRKVLKLKGKDLAERVGCHPPDISDWENDKNKPSVESLVKLAKALDTTETWLVSGKYSRDENPKITQMPTEYKGEGVEEGINAEFQRLEEMLNDKRDLIKLLKEKNLNLESRIAKLEDKKRNKSSKNLTG